MANIEVLLPRQNVLDCANQVIAKDGRKIRLVQLIENSEAVAAARKAVENGVQILVARGYQAMLIKENLGIPVVEISLTVQDIGLLVRKIRAQLHKEHPSVAIVHMENMLPNTEHLEELFNFELRTYFLKNLEEVPEKVDLAIREGADIVVGGLTANQAAMERGFPAVFADTSEDSIRNALDEAENIGKMADMERSSNAQLSTILDTSYNGIIKLNTSMEIVAANRMIEDVLGKTASSIAGMSLEQVFPEIDREGILKILTGEQELFYGSMAAGDQLMIVTGAPIRFEQGIGGAILSFQKIRKTVPENRKNKEPSFRYCAARGNFSMFRRTGAEMGKCLELARSYACSSNPILICGESGTEKELLAAAIHNNSPQKDGSFYMVNCGTLTEEEQEQLFEGVYNERKGEWEKVSLWQQNTGGTIYLRKLEKLSPKSQYMLADVIEHQACWNGAVMIPGRQSSRLLADTSVPSDEILSDGALIPELFYLLTLRLEIPSLRHTKKEIPQLAREYIDSYRKQYSQYIELEAEAYTVLQNYRWEGNLVQLQHFCECLVLSARKRKIRSGFVQELLRTLYPVPGSGEHRGKTEGTEEEMIVRTLNQCKGNKAEAARVLGISSTTLWRRMNKYNISKNYNGA